MSCTGISRQAANEATEGVNTTKLSVQGSRQCCCPISNRQGAPLTALGGAAQVHNLQHTVGVAQEGNAVLVGGGQVLQASVLEQGTTRTDSSDNEILAFIQKTIPQSWQAKTAHAEVKSHTWHS